MKAYEVSSQCQIQFFIFLFNKFNRNRFNLLLPVAAWFSNKHPNICIYYITRMGLSPNPTTFRKLCNNFPSNCIIYATIWNTCLESVYIHQRRALRISFHLFIAGSQPYFYICKKKNIVQRSNSYRQKSTAGRRPWMPRQPVSGCRHPPTSCVPVKLRSDQTKI